jgi:hypothetical protein
MMSGGEGQGVQMERKWFRTKWVATRRSRLQTVKGGE